MEVGTTNNREFLARYIQWLQDYEDIGNSFRKRRGDSGRVEEEQEWQKRRDPRLGYTYRKAKDWLLTELRSALTSEKTDDDVDRWANELKVTEERESQFLRSRDNSCARAALAYYNIKHGADYELVEAMRSYAIEHLIGLWHHCNFTARRKSESGGEAAPKVFFAEVCLRQGRYEVKYCENLSESGVKIYYGCGSYCPTEIRHPPFERYQDHRLNHANKFSKFQKNHGKFFS